jgi:hypothetical protein
MRKPLSIIECTQIKNRIYIYIYIYKSNTAAGKNGYKCKTTAGQGVHMQEDLVTGICCLVVQTHTDEFVLISLQSSHTGLTHTAISCSPRCNVHCVTHIVTPCCYSFHQGCGTVTRFQLNTAARLKMTCFGKLHHVVSQKMPDVSEKVTA